jgi:hypothetical protein
LWHLYACTTKHEKSSTTNAQAKALPVTDIVAVLVGCLDMQRLLAGIQQAVRSSAKATAAHRCQGQPE